MIKKKRKKRLWDLGHEPSPLHLRPLKSQHHENSSSTSNPTLSVSCTCTLCELHPPPSHLTSLIMSFKLGPGVLVSSGRLALSHPLLPCVLLPRLAFARSATPSRPCFRWLGLQFTVGETSSTDHVQFLYSLYYL